MGWSPIYCDLDLVKNKITIPGCIAAVVLNESFLVKLILLDKR